MIVRNDKGKTVLHILDSDTLEEIENTHIDPKEYIEHMKRKQFDEVDSVNLLDEELSF